MENKMLKYCTRFVFSNLILQLGNELRVKIELGYKFNLFSLYLIHIIHATSVTRYYSIRQGIKVTLLFWITE